MKIQELLNQSKPCWKYAAIEQSGWDTEKALTTPKIVGRPKNK